MNEGAFHVLFDFAEREPLAFVGILFAIPSLIAFLALATVRRINPVAVWLVLGAAFFGLSQVFPENRNQRPSIAIGDGVLCAVLVWWWFGRVAPGIRAKLRRTGSAG